jgi:hypothetical protein
MSRETRVEYVVSSHPTYAEALERLIKSLRKWSPETLERLWIVLSNVPRSLVSIHERVASRHYKLPVVSVTTNSFEMTSITGIAKRAPWRSRRYAEREAFYVLLHDTMEALPQTQRQIKRLEAFLSKISCTQLFFKA